MLLFYLIDLLLKDPLQFVVAFTMLVVPLLISITFHEWSHGFVAYKFGDPTAKMYGRLTLNPFAHLDPMGTLMLFLIGIGWAKPVPVNILNIPSRTKQMLVALAGPMSNVLLAIIFSVVLVCFTAFYKGETNAVTSLFTMTTTIVVRINLILAIFNMIPIPPFDGSRVFAWILPEKLSEKYLSLEPFGIAFIFLLIFSGGLKFIIILSDFLQLKLLEGIRILLAPVI